MKTCHWGVAALALAALMAPGQSEAAPAPRATGITNAASIDRSIDLVAAHRACWRENGVRHCRQIDATPRRAERPNDSDGPLDPRGYRTGSARWWQEMDRAGRGGQSDTP